MVMNSFSSENFKFKPSDYPWLKFYPQNISNHLEYSEMSLFRILDNTAKDYPDNIALIFYGKKIKYRKLKQWSDKFALALQSLGIQKGDRIVLLLPNCPQFAIAYYAALKIGAIVTFLNPLYTPKELNYILSDSQPKAIISLQSFSEKISKINNLPAIIIFSDIVHYLPFSLKTLLRLKNILKKQREINKENNIYSFEKLLKKSSEKYQPIPIEPKHDTALLMYTSGTTGQPKGVEISHFNAITNLIQMSEWLKSVVNKGKETVLGVLPFFHIYGITTVLNFCILSGLSIVLFPEFHSKPIAKAIEKYKITFVPTVPAILSALYKVHKNNPKRYTFKSVKFWGTGASACPIDLITKIKGINKQAIFIEGYGLTETSPVIIMNPPANQKNGSIGIPFPDTECKIVDPATNQELGPGKIGELIVRGPQVFSKYWQNSQATNLAFDENGWFHTKDMALMDKDGYFYIKGRIDNMINVRGEKVWPQEIEKALEKHPAVKEAAVIGVPDEFFGQIPKAFIVLKDKADDQSKLRQELIEFCKKYLTQYKIPKEIEFVDEIPKSHIGKKLYYILRKEDTHDHIIQSK